MVHIDLDTANMTNEELDIIGSISALTKAIEAGFVGLCAKLDKVRLFNTKSKG